MNPEDAPAVAGNGFSRPQTQRKSSLSDVINKLTTNAFNRRRTTTLLPHSASGTHFHHKSRLPTPSGIPRSTSFLSSLNNFISHNTETQTHLYEHEPPQHQGKRPRKISERLAQTPFVQQQSLHPSSPTTTVAPCKRRESSVKIEQRGLMQPMPPPLPKSTTMGDLLSAHKTSSTLQLTPNASRPASSHPDRKGSLVMSKRPNVLTPPMRIVKLQKTPGSFPKRKDSLMPSPARATAVLQDAGSKASATLSASPDLSFVEEDTVLKVSNKQGKSAYQHHSMNRKQQSSFKEDFESENLPDLQRIAVDEEEDRSSEDDQHKQESPNEENSRVITNSDDANDPRLIHSPKPPTYWLGRYTALSDTTRSSALAPSRSCMENRPESSSSALSLSDHNHPMHNTAQRDKAVFSHLRALCTTDEARESLAVFAGLMSAAMEEAGKRSGDGFGEGKKGMRKSVGGGVREKKGWLEGLMGRRRASGEKE